MGLPALKFRGCDYMPIRLKGVLINRGISQPDLAATVLQANGKPISRTSLSLLINWGYYPRSTPQADIHRQVEQKLREWKVPEEEIATLWEAEGDDDYRAMHPAGAHLGQPSPKPAGFRKPAPDIEPVEIEMLSPAAKRHFKLFRDPFQDDVTGPEDVFLSAEQRYIAEAMFQTAKHGGFLAVAGESGSGKSTLRKTLIERVKGHPIRVIFPRALDKTRLSTGNICQAIINDLAPGTTFRSSLEAQARQVEEVLMQSSRADNSHVLVIEEAHDLSISTLKYLKRFYELEDGFKKLLAIVLIGQPELKDKLDERRHPEAREVIRRCELAELLPLDADLEKYLAHKLKRVGVELPAIFAEDACQGIRARLTKQRSDRREAHAASGAQVSQLYPLVVNNLVTKAMNRAAELGVPLISADLVREL